MPKNHKNNRWHESILEVLRTAAPEARTTDEIWNEVVARGFHHGSKNPRATLGGRIAELRAGGLVERVGHALYRAMPVVVSPVVENLEQAAEIGL